MDQTLPFALCFRRSDGLLRPISEGRATLGGLYALALAMGRVREVFPTAALVVDDCLIRSVDISAAGLRLHGHRVVVEAV